MKNRVPVKREGRPPLPTFEPVPRKCKRHDGWTPARQKAFIEALADTGSVSRACAMVNMTTNGAYYLRRQAGAEEFRRAWEAALDFGVARMKDIAFERAITGYLVPMMVGGKLIGWRRKYNDRLLMFCLRHYGEDANGKRTKIEYFSTRAQAGVDPGSSPGLRQPAGAAASATTVRTVISGPSTSPGSGPGLDLAAEAVESFDGVELDEEARDAIAAVLRDCAARRREVAGTPDDESELFIAARQATPAYDVVADPEEMVEARPQLFVPPDEQYRSGDGEFAWEMLDDEEGMAVVEEAVASVKKAKEKQEKSKRLRNHSKA